MTIKRMISYPYLEVTKGINGKVSINYVTVCSITYVALPYVDPDIDGVVLTTGDTVLLMDNGIDNGLYVYDGIDLVRSPNLDIGAKASFSIYFAKNGDSFRGFYVCTNASGSDVVGTDSLSFCILPLIPKDSMIDGSQTLLWNFNADYIFSMYNFINGNLLHLELTPSIGTNGGTFTSGVWQPLTFGGGLVSSIYTININNYDFTITVNGYFSINAYSTAYGVDSHQIRLWDVTNNVMLCRGNTAFSNSTNPSNTVSSIKEDYFSIINAPVTVRIEHRCSTTGTNTGFGRAAGLTNEKYRSIRIMKTNP